MIATGESSGPAESSEVRPAQWRSLLAIALGQALMGASRWSGSLWALAWIGVATLAVGLEIPCSVGGLVSLYLGCVVGLCVAFPWHLATVSLYVASPAGAFAGTAALTAIWATMRTLPIALVWIVATCSRSRSWRIPAWLWLPPAFLAGEALWNAAGGLSYDSWLYSQFRNPLVLRAVGDLGWTPAGLACLAIASLLGLGLARRSWLEGVAGVLGIAALASLSPLPAGNLEPIADVGAVHLASFFHPPRSAPPGIDLLIWPEGATSWRPRLSEGQPRGLRLAPPFASSRVYHVVGALTRCPRGRQDSLLALAPDGTVLQMRAKRRLCPAGEAPFLGYSLPQSAHLVRGKLAPVLTVLSRRIGALICSEEWDVGLALEVARDRCEFLAISADDRPLPTALARRQILATAVLDAVMTHLPVVRASIWGLAAIVAPDGRILARSRYGTDGILTLAGRP